METTFPASFYLLSSVSNNIGQFLYNEIDTLEAGFLQPRYLFLHDSLEGHVGREKTNSDSCTHSIFQPRKMDGPPIYFSVSIFEETVFSAYVDGWLEYFYSKWCAVNGISFT